MHPVASCIAILCVAFLAIIALAPYIIGTNLEDFDDAEKQELDAKAARDESEYGPLK